MKGRKMFPAIVRTIVFFVIISAGSMILPQQKLQAQSYDMPFLLNSRIIERFMDQHEERSEFGEELSEYLEDLLKNPIHINSIQTESRDRLLILNDFQIYAICNYLERHGPVRSCAELSLINGFDYAFARGISPFIDFSSDSRFSTFREAFTNRNFGHRLALKTQWRTEIERFRIVPPDNLNHDRISLHTRYDFEWGRHLSASVTYEKDDGERFLVRRGKIIEPEMMTYSLSLQDIRLSRNLLLEQLVLGDFNVTFGQGICISGTGTLFGGADPSSVGRKPDPLKMCRHENGLLFGIGAGLTYLLKKHRLQFNTFFSNKRLDARIENGTYTSLPSGGLHNTTASLKSRRQIFLISFGNRLNVQGKNWEAGIHHILYRYSRENGIVPQYWNRYRLFEGWWGNIGSDFTYSHRLFRCFGEIAVDFTPALSGLLGCTVFASEKAAFSFIYRGFGVRYKSPLAVNTGFNSTPDNEQSLELLTEFSLDYRWKINLSARGAFHPYYRYGIKRPSMQGLVSGKILRTEKTWNADASLGIRLRTYDSPVLIRSRLSSRLLFSDFDLRFRAGIHYNPLSRKRPGTYLSLEGGWKQEWKRIRTAVSTSCGATFFDCIEWDTRNYVYESDLLHTFSSHLLYGTGIRGYLLLCLKTRHTETRIKAGCEIRERLRCIRPVAKLQLILKL